MPAAAEQSKRARTAVLPRLGRGLLRLLVTVLLGFMVLLAVIDATGRIRIVAAPGRTLGTAYTSSDLLVVVPVPAQRLRVGDVVVIRNPQEHALLRIEKIVDSQGPEVRVAGDPKGKIRKLGGTTYRVSMAVPELGYPMRLIAGPIQALLLVGVGFLLIVRAEVRRARETVRTRAPAIGPSP